MSLARAYRVFVGLLLITLTGCGSSPEEQPHVLELTATGTAEIKSLKYTLDGRVVRDGAATLPWSDSVSVPSDGQEHTWALQAEHGDGDIELVATVDGQLFTQGSGSGSGGTTGHVSIDGSITG